MKHCPLPPQNCHLYDLKIMLKNEFNLNFKKYIFIDLFFLIQKNKSLLTYLFFNLDGIHFRLDSFLKIFHDFLKMFFFSPH